MVRLSATRRDVLLATLAAGMAPRAFAESGNRSTFSAPHEGAPHARTWMCWPSRVDIYDDDPAYFEDVQATLGRLAASIAAFEPVSMLAGAEHHALARQLCGPRVELIDIPTDDMWARDSGPVFVSDPSGDKAVVDFNFNGWGNRQDHGRDTLVAGAIAQRLGVQVLRDQLVGEGGGLEYDGDGTLILTESCWVNDNRNPGLSRDEIESSLKRLLGVEKVIWLPGVRDHDITDGHIDGSLRIVEPGLLMASHHPDDQTSVWAEAQAEALSILNASRDARGRSFDIVTIDSATAPRSDHPELFTSYANYYVANGAVFTPEFGDRRADRKAIQTLGQLYPQREIVALNADRIYECGGGIHCVTQQEPL